MSPVTLECKKLCIQRCLHALAVSVWLQFVLLGIYLLFVNFEISHPYNWLLTTIGLLFSVTTWISIIPLIAAILIYGVLLGKAHLLPNYYYATRLKWLLHTSLPKFCFLSLHIIVGLSTSLLYVQYLDKKYSNFKVDCNGHKCMSSNFGFLILAGIAAGCFHFFKESIRKDPAVVFPIVQEKKLVKIRSLLYTTLFNYLLKSFMLTWIYVLSYWIVGYMFSKGIASLFFLKTDNNLNSIFNIATNIRLLFYTWIILTQVLTNMQLMKHLYSIYLAEEYFFELEKPNIISDSDKYVLTLTGALSTTQVPIVQTLAAMEFLRIAKTKNKSKRKVLFSLSVPGSHPYIWNEISTQALCLINYFTAELKVSVQNISAVRSGPSLPMSLIPPPNRLNMVREYNAMYGIRYMRRDSPPIITPKIVTQTPCQRINKYFDDLGHRFWSNIQNFFFTLPGVNYMLGEAEGSYTAYLLSNSLTINWLTEAFSSICVASFVEDNFGVVQESLADIIRAIINLKQELDKLNNVSFNGKRIDYNLLQLRNTTKRSLHRICSVFGNYLRDIISDPDELKIMQSFLNQIDLAR